MQRKITGFHLDAENHFVAELACGHGQHVRHDPPWQERPWVISPEGRNSRLGTELDCKRCDEAGEKVARAVLKECEKSLREAYESGGMSGLCQEGRWDLALDSLKKLDLKAIAESALEE